MKNKFILFLFIFFVGIFTGCNAGFSPNIFNHKSQQENPFAGKKFLEMSALDASPNDGWYLFFDEQTGSLRNIDTEDDNFFIKFSYSCNTSNQTISFKLKQWCIRDENTNELVYINTATEMTDYTIKDLDLDYELDNEIDDEILGFLDFLGIEPTKTGMMSFYYNFFEASFRQTYTVSYRIGNETPNGIELYTTGVYDSNKDWIDQTNGIWADDLPIEHYVINFGMKNSYYDIGSYRAKSIDINAPNVFYDFDCYLNGKENKISVVFSPVTVDTNGQYLVTANLSNDNGDESTIEYKFFPLPLSDLIYIYYTAIDW